MLKVAEVGNSDRQGQPFRRPCQRAPELVNAQYDLRNADFLVIIWIAGDDRIAANEVVNRINEWMDARFIDTRAFADYSRRKPTGRRSGAYGVPYRQSGEDGCIRRWLDDRHDAPTARSTRVSEAAAPCPRHAERDGGRRCPGDQVLLPHPRRSCNARS